MPQASLSDYFLEVRDLDGALFEVLLRSCLFFGGHPGSIASVEKRIGAPIVRGSHDIPSFF